MAYFGGTGVREALHPSFQAYIDCFKRKPMIGMYPRGGGPWDQDPILMRDFRLIQDMEVQWKENQDKMRAELDNEEPGIIPESGGGTGLEGALDEYIQQLEEDGDIF